MLPRKSITICFLLLSFAACAANTNLAQTAAHVKLTRYVGHWYQIAAVPNNFQRGCRCSSTDYELRDESIIVENRCIRNEERKLVKGKAWVVPDTKQSQLTVQFYWPFKINYWILYVDSDYQEALVGTPDRSFLWILAREPELPESRYQELTEIASRQGYDVSQLRYTDQSCNV